MSGKIRIVSKTNRNPVEYYSWVEGGQYLPTGAKMENVYTLPNISDFPRNTFEKYNKYQLTESTMWKCDEKVDHKGDLFLYQQFVREFLSLKTPYRGLLLYYGLGSGKTRAAIEIAKQYRKIGQEVVFISPASLVDNYLQELAKWGAISHEDLGNILGLSSRKSKLNALKRLGYSLVSYNAPNKLAQLKTLLKEGEKRIKNKVIIVDEVHNMSQFLHNGINQPQRARRATSLEFYNLLYYATNCRFIFLSGTPMINVPSEMAITFNLLRGPMEFRPRPKNITVPTTLNQTLPSGIRQKNNTPSSYPVFPLDKEEFDEIFVDWENLQIKSGQSKLFKDRILGLVSHYSGAKGDVYPDIVGEDWAKPGENEVPWIMVEVPMSEFQILEYEDFRELERQSAKKKKEKKKATKKELNLELQNEILEEAKAATSTFRIKTRQVSNFSLPDELKELRPKSISAEPERLKELYTEFNQLNEAFDEGENIFHRDNLVIFSPKMYTMLDILEQDLGTERDGNSLVYSNFRSIEGIEIFARVLEANGYTWYNPEDPDDFERRDIYNKDEPEPPRFAILGSDYRTKGQDYTTEILELFNDPENKRGEIIKVVLGTANIAEGISLFNIRKVLIMEPHWNMVRINQLVGRARRICSHRQLPRDQWSFQVYIFMSTIPEVGEGGELTKDLVSTDQVLLEIAERKEIVKRQFDHSIKESAVDCLLNATHNENKKKTPPVNCVFYPEVEDETVYTYFPDINDVPYDPYKRQNMDKRNAKKHAQKAPVQQPQRAQEVRRVTAMNYTPSKNILGHNKLKAKYIDSDSGLEKFSVIVDPKTKKGQKVVITFKDDADKKEWIGVALYDRSSLQHTGEMILKGYMLQGRPAWPLAKKSQVKVIKEYY